MAVADSRALVRCLFLASAVDAGVLDYLRTERTFDELADHLQCSRPDRLQAWLWVGTGLGEIDYQSPRYGLQGTRARAIAGGDDLLTAHYRSMLEYQVAPYSDLAELLAQSAGQGRDDLARYADDIARVSLAAAPFVATLVRQVVADVAPRRLLDIGCGTGTYTLLAARSQPEAEVVGVELAGDVASAAREEVARAHLAGRVQIREGDVRSYLRGDVGRFDVVLLLNNVYYFDRAERVSLYREIAAALEPGGEVLLTTMAVPGSIAATHLHFMLSCQAGTAGLPQRSELRADLAGAGFAVVEDVVLVPGEPFVGIRARLGPAATW
jgi:4-hydroxy-2,2'-bipyrrole-5-carbaldehyde O-methyltransferase